MSLGQRNVIIVTGRERGCGKTHVGCGLSRWLSDQGYSAAPLHLPGREPREVECPGGGVVSRGAALLAEACRLAPDPLYESGWEGLGKLPPHDAVVVEADWAEAAGRPGIWLEVERRGGRLRVNGQDMPWFEPGLGVEQDGELELLPRWEYATRPRIAVVSLPHLADFGDLRYARGAEWLTGPGAGRFEVVVVPATNDEALDREWLEDARLSQWLKGQAARGARVLACQWDVDGAERVAREVLTGYKQMSRILGRRLAAPLPDDAVFDQMGEWFARWGGLQEFRRNHL